MSLVIFLAGAGIAALAVAEDGWLPGGFTVGSSADYYRALIGEVTGKQQEYAELFVVLQSGWFSKAYLAVITAVPFLFLLHFLVVGAKHFRHDGKRVLFFSLFARVVHFFAAICFSLLILTGLLMVFGAFFGGGLFVRTARNLHLLAAMVFAVPAMMMFFMWLKDMLPQRHDLAWMCIAGGYLSRKKRPVPAGKFNAGQKMYFWFTMAGGGVLAFTGALLFSMNASIDTLRLSAVIHNILGISLVAFYLTHLYMSIFAVSGSLQSMRTGFKWQDEVDMLHSRYSYQQQHFHHQRSGQTEGSLR